MQLSVIIVNYNVRYFLEQCLFSVQKAMRGINGEIWVVDNASKDGSRAYLEPLFPQVKFIWNAENFGFSKANNQALQYATGSFILFLNPDTILPEDCFSKCLDFFKNNLDAGALGVRMLDGNGNFLPESKRSFPSPSISFFKLSGLSSLLTKSKLFGKYHLGFLDENENHEVNVLAGAFMLV
ncbi:MAG: glycosyltransferase family 2 protein, partial [Bacteroidota bacterium]